MNASRQINPTHRRSGRPGFTLAELMVVIGIIVLLIAVAVPSVSAIYESGRVEAGVNTVSAAVAAARAYAGRDTMFVEDLDEDTPGIQSGEYSGVALLFTPMRELRIVQNTELAKTTGGNYLETLSTALNGYVDINRDYIRVPKGVGFVGISRGSSPTNSLQLMAPPFAVRFNPEGNLIAGQSSHRFVYYNADRDDDDEIDTGVNRGNPYGSDPYVPGEWDPESPLYSPGSSPRPGKAEKDDKYRLPFDEIETVVGLIVFDLNQFRSAGHRLYDQMSASDGSNWGGGDDDQAGKWIVENGQPVFFSRYSGAVMKED